MLTGHKVKIKFCEENDQKNSTLFLIQILYQLDRVQLNFLHLSNAHAVQRISFAILSHHHPAHQRWKNETSRDKIEDAAAAFQFKGSNGEDLASSTREKNHQQQQQLQESFLVESRCEHSTTRTHISQSHTTQTLTDECTMHFELSTHSISVVDIELFPIVDISTPTKMCLGRACRTRIGPVCFTKDSSFSGG